MKITNLIGDRRNRPKSPPSAYLFAAAVILGITPLLLLLELVLNYRAIGLIYLASIVLVALFVSWGPVLFSAIFSLVVWDFFFLRPIPSFTISNKDDLLLAGTYLIVSILLGAITTRIRAQERARKEGEEMSNALYQLTRELSHASTPAQLALTIQQQLRNVFSFGSTILQGQLSGMFNPKDLPPEFQKLSDAEKSLVQICLEKRLPVGRFTGIKPESDRMVLPLLANPETRCIGIVIMDVPSEAVLSENRRELLDTFMNQISLALERQFLREESANNRLLVESEKLGKSLLDTISHEIRTPLAAIQAALASMDDAEDAPPRGSNRNAMMSEIKEAAERLDRLVGNVLDITRVESGRLTPRFAPCDVSDLVHVCIKELRKQSGRHNISTELQPALPLVEIDFVLIQHALGNLISNALRHTPPGTAIRIHARGEGGNLILTVADNGPGIPKECLPRIFDKFYRGPGAPTGGTGLGLSLVKGFVEAHHGTVTAENMEPVGARFTICLPCIINNLVKLS